MKRGFYTLFLISIFLLYSMSAFAAFESVSLRVGQSKVIKDVNFTLLKTNQDDGKAIICVNNRKAIISDSLSIDNSIVKIKDVFSSAASFDIDVSCEGKCVCGSECSNKDCIVSASEPVCSSDTDCDDDDFFTTDLCISNVCVHRPAQLTPCEIDSECNDNDPCTTDQCSKVLKKCIHIGIENCLQLPEQPSQQPQNPTLTSIPLTKLSAFILLGITSLLLIALIIKRFIK